MKSKKKTTQIELNTETKSSNKSGGFLRFFKNNIIFRIFFPSLLYSSDFDDIKPDSLTFKLITDSTSLNKLVKAIAGIFGSWIIIYFVYFYLRYHLKVAINTAVPLLIIIFLIVLIGLSFSNPKFRCIILLIIPFMATSRGKYFNRIFSICIRLVTNWLLNRSMIRIGGCAVSKRNG